MTRLTAFIIATNEIDCQSAGPDENGKYAGWISRMENGNWRPLISTKAVFDTEKDAITAMEEIAAAARKAVEEETGDKHSHQSEGDQDGQ